MGSLFPGSSPTSFIARNYEHEILQTRYRAYSFFLVVNVCSCLIPQNWTALSRAPTHTVINLNHRKVGNCHESALNPKWPLDYLSGQRSIIAADPLCITLIFVNWICCVSSFHRVLFWAFNVLWYDHFVRVMCTGVGIINLSIWLENLVQSAHDAYLLRSLN